jgi:hypothetical protein
MADLKVDLGFRTLKNPLIMASGTFGYGEEFQPFYDLDLLGAIVMKGIFKEPRPGNPGGPAEFHRPGRPRQRQAAGDHPAPPRQHSGADHRQRLRRG